MSNTYVGVDGLARKVTGVYVGVNGIARKVSKGYIGANGVARLFYSAAQPVQLLSALNVGDTLESPVASSWQSRFGQKIVWRVADKNHEGYPENSVTLISDKVIQLVCSDAKESSNSDTRRKASGNNRHIYSNVLQWLNSSATAGDWYSAQHVADAPPANENVWNSYNEYDAWPGFITILGSGFAAKILETTLKVVKALTDGGSYETFAAKMFLASKTETGLGNENYIAEGSQLSLFDDDDSRIAYPTPECVSNSEYTSSDFTTSNGCRWWLRTPNSAASASVCGISAGGAINYVNAYEGRVGIRPLCNLSGDNIISQSPNENGNYTFAE